MQKEIDSRSSSLVSTAPNNDMVRSEVAKNPEILFQSFTNLPVWTVPRPSNFLTLPWFICYSVQDGTLPNAFEPLQKSARSLRSELSSRRIKRSLISPTLLFRGVSRRRKNGWRACSRQIRQEFRELWKSAIRKHSSRFENRGQASGRRSRSVLPPTRGRFRSENVTWQRFIERNVRSKGLHVLRAKRAK